MENPRLGITLGDPAGIGPEIIVKVLSDRVAYSCFQPVVFAHRGFLNREKPGFIETAERAGITFVDVSTAGPDEVPVGCVSAQAGNASYAYIEAAIAAAKRGEIDALVTAPITKAALALAKIPYRDHTEILAAAWPGEVVTLLGNPMLKVVHVMRHLSLRESVVGVSYDKVLDTIMTTHRTMRAAYSRAPRLFVAGLNPHNGDAGLMGDEEKTIILPAVIAAQKEGVLVEGPIAADSVFPLAMEGGVDAVIALYHDQGHIAIKASDWRRSYGLTLGLPVLRSSVDHGSALDIAGRGVAHPGSLLAAIDVVLEILLRR